MNYFDMHDQELPDCGARVILANDVSATCALPAGHLGPHASSNRVCTCVDAGYVIGSDPNCPRHAIPNRVQPGTFGPVFDAGVEEGKRQARHAIPNSAAKCRCLYLDAPACTYPDCAAGRATPNRVTKEQNDRIVKRLEDMEFTETEVDMICRVFTEEWLDA